MRETFSRFLQVSMLALAATLPALATTYTVPAPSGGDDTGAIQPLLNSANTAGPGNNTVLLQAGTYHAGPLFIGSHTVLQGAGAANTFLIFNVASQDGDNLLRNKLGSFQVNANHNESITLKGITFDGNKAAQTANRLQIVRMINVTHLTVDGCVFQNGEANGLVIEGTTGNQSDTLVENSSAFQNEARGFYANSADETTNGLRGVTYQNCLARDNSGGFSAYLSKDIQYIHCTAVHNGFIARGLAYGDDDFDITEDANPGFGLDSSIFVSYTDCLSEDNLRYGFAAYARARPTHDLTYTRATSTGNGTAHAADDPTGTALSAAGFHIQTSYDSTYTDCQSSENGIGFELVSNLKETLGVNPVLTHDILIQGADIRNNREQGILMEGVTDSTVTGSLVVDNSTSAPASYDGVLLQNGIQNASDEGSQRVTISECTIGNTSNSSHQAYSVHSIDACDFVSLLGNTLSGDSLSSSLAVSYSLVGSHNTVQGNH
jgi:hypothetical protein